MQHRVEEIILFPTNDENPSQEQFFTEFQPHNRSDNRRRPFYLRLLTESDPRRCYYEAFLWVFLFGGLFLLVLPLIMIMSNSLPGVKPRTTPLDEFSEERARDHYPNLSYSGARVIDTFANQMAGKYLHLELFRIRSMARSTIRFEIVRQNLTDSKFNSVENIAVRLSNRNSSKPRPCLMLAAHFDSVEFSPGGSDDGSGIVVLLEILFNLVNDLRVTFENVELIVLFSNAEEVGSRGAFYFVQSNPWMNEVRRFINLDSIGSGGRALLVRVKPSQLIRDYAHLSRPHANVIGDDLFEMSNFYTDYSVFTEFRSLMGYEFSIYQDGYAYHTALDTDSKIAKGTIQHLGETILALSRHILSGSVNVELPQTIVDDDRMVYFDFLGFYLLMYQQRTSDIIEIILIVLIIAVAIAVIVHDHIQYKREIGNDDMHSLYFYFARPLLLRFGFLAIFFICYILSILIGTLCTGMVALVMKFIRPFSWHDKSSLPIFLYGLPLTIGILLSEILWTILRRQILSRARKRNPMEPKTIHHIDRYCFHLERHLSLLFVFIILMGFHMITSRRSFYIILVWSICVCPIYCMLISLNFIRPWTRKSWPVILNEPKWYWLFAPYFVSFFPLIHSLEMTIRYLRFFIPMTARLADNFQINPEFLCALLSIVPASLFFLVFIPNIQRYFNHGRALTLLLLSFLIVLIFACIQTPFTAIRPRIVEIRQSSNSTMMIKDNEISQIGSINSKVQFTSRDGLPLKPTIDHISLKTGYDFHNGVCSKKTYCIYGSPFNKPLAVNRLSLDSIDSPGLYRISIDHSPSTIIDIVPSHSLYVPVIEKRTPTKSTIVIDTRISTLLFSRLHFFVEIKRCDVNDSLLFRSIKENVPDVILWGSPECQSITDSLFIIIEP